MKWRWGEVLAIVGMILAVAGVAGALRRWPIDDATLRARVLDDLQEVSGLTVTASGPMTLSLLPRPTIALRDIAIRGLDDAIVLDAEVMHARIDLAALIDGRFQVSSTSFDAPTVALDLDRLQPIVTAMLDRSAMPASLALLHTGGITLHDGVVRLRSQDHRRDGLLTELSATLAWPSNAAEASLAGSGTWRGINGAFGIDIARPAEALDGGQTLASARLKSTALDLDLQGTLSGGDSRQAVGKLVASTSNLPAFLRTIDMPTPQLGALHGARLTGSASLSGDTVSFDPVTLELDDMTFEGALAVHLRDDRTGLAGTLATDNIVLDPFLQALPVFFSPAGGWSQAALGTRSVAYDDIDLRISATAARFRSFVMEDGSLSLQSGDGRMELSIGEARAYDGLLKGRIVATMDGGQTDIRADATLSRLDLKALLKDVPGRYPASGTISSHLALDARGVTPADLARSVGGRAQMNVRDGAIGPKLLAAIVQAAPSASQPPMPLVAAGAVPFEAAAFDVAVANGTATLDDGSIAWPSLHAVVEGVADVSGQTVDIRARVSPVDGEAAAEATTVYALRGPWRDLRLKPARPRS